MIRVLIADDEHLIRGALISLLGAEEDIRVVADTGEGRAVTPLAREHRPDVAVLDVNLPDMNGLEVTARLQEALPQCRVLLLTSLDRPGTVRQALDQGVAGYLLKDASPSALATAIRKVAAAQRVIAPELMLAAWQARSNPLTPRETEVLVRASEGLDIAGVAEATRLSPGTVRNYLSRCVMKLGARGRVDAVRIAREAGWLVSSSASAAHLPDTSP
ncbi:response regulator transcription factor [Streptomyces fuscichromogenes]|uniref:DNA-binding response regulator n=1 Tax=Streptomyces fuscichromogenes TaxID=1324013 RepID=A0A918CVA6_9ACTN|nr:response regulator transcription factor [Streptomyces fuscichromogenes]GGN33717.1 DNA-binding response regulator [Streptomyces fuscichromogenes]